MEEQSFYTILLLGIFAIAAGTAIFSFFTTAPYGRYARPWWSGPDMPSSVAWMAMEAPQLVGFVVWFVLGERQTQPMALVFFCMWVFHYCYRTLVYPFVPRASSMSLFVVALGFVLNSCFSYLNARWLFTLGPVRGLAWLGEPRCVVGAALFAAGFVLSVSSDLILRNLRKPGEKSYRIPYGGGFRWVTSPNYLGELVEWLGWSCATWSLAGLAIAAVSAANLVPRALRNHRWYRERFPEYPANRKALVPYLF
jgi:protein-S-isoprenylcysteine O-methyltransferase Ste14